MKIIDLISKIPLEDIYYFLRGKFKPRLGKPIVISHSTVDFVDWGEKLLKVPDLWQQTQGEGIKVAVLDTGCDINHQDLKEGIVEYDDFTRQGIDDVQGHGTHTSGILGARANGIGMVGVAPKCSLYPVKVLSNNGSGDYSILVKGIEWCIQKKMDIISMSLGGPFATRELEMACQAAYDAGIVLVAASGNENGPIGYPAKFDSVISVGSINEKMERSGFSDYGKELDVVAPGEQIYSCFPENKYAKLSGTSMSTPFVSGVIALMLAKHRQPGEHKTPINSPKDAREHLIRNAIDKGEQGFDFKYGYGIINPVDLMD